MTNLLCLTGGGFKGLFSLAVLEELVDTCSISKNIQDHVDVFAGTSSGAIIAAALACKIPLHEITQKFEAHGHEIFHKLPFGPRGPGFLKSRYRHEPIRSVLEDIFGADTKLGDVEKPLILTAVDAETCNPVIMKSFPYPGKKETNHYEDQRLCDLVLASAAAPTYFPLIRIPAVEADSLNDHSRGWVTDGGIIANSPDLIAVVETQKTLGTNFSNMRVLSLGSTWSTRRVGRRFFGKLISPKFRKSWGLWGFLIDPYRPGYLLQLVFNAQSRLSHHLVGQLLSADKYVRIDRHVSRRFKIGLDAVERRTFLRSEATRTVEHYLNSALEDPHKVQLFFSSAGR